MSDGATDRLSVVVPAWNAVDRVEACLRALAGQSRPADEVVVVDNGSTDGTAEVVHRLGLASRLVRLSRNVGFAQGVNHGIAAAAGATIVLLNDDTVPEAGFLEALVAPLATDARLGACAGTLVYASAPDVVNSAGIAVGRDLVALDAAMGAPLASLPAEPWTVFGPSGGAVALRRTMLDDVGLFDARFFAYLEDVDLAWRMRLRGWRTVAVSTARARHAYSASGGADSAFKRYHLARNRLWWLVKNVPTGVWRRCWPAVAWYDAAALVAAVASHDAAWLRGRREGMRGAMGMVAERRAIQARRVVSDAAVLAALGPRVGPLRVWRERRVARRSAAV